MTNHITPPSSHHWTLRSAVALSAIIALFGTWGWLTHYGLLARDLAVVAGGALMSGVCLVAQGVCNNLAVEARRARARGLVWSFRYALLVALGFGAISALGLHHGWQIAAAVAPSLGVSPPPDWLTTILFVFVAFGEPVAFWVVDAIRSHEVTVDDQEKNSDHHRWSPRVVASDQPRARTRRAATTVSLVGATALAMGGAGAPVDAGLHPHLSAPAMVSIAYEEAAKRVQTMVEQRWSERRIARELGVSRHAVRVMLGRVSRAGAA